MLILKDNWVFTHTIGVFLIFSTLTKMVCPLVSFSKIFSSTLPLQRWFVHWYHFQKYFHLGQ